MARVSSKETKPEIYVRKRLFAEGFRFRKNDKRYPGNPDIVLPKFKTIIFVHGCFWHNHENCKHSKLPSSNIEYWTQKIDKNAARDERAVSKLEIMGWRVITIWTCELDTAEKRNNTIAHLIFQLRKTD